MTAPWGGKLAPAPPQPVVLVSSRDGAEVPPVPAAVRLARAAEASGWIVRQTYALAEVPATSHRAAHQLASVAVRVVRGDMSGRSGWAIWHRIDDGPWRFSTAMLGPQRLGIREFASRIGAP